MRLLPSKTISPDLTPLCVYILVYNVWTFPSRVRITDLPSTILTIPCMSWGGKRKWPHLHNLATITYVHSVPGPLTTWWFLTHICMASTSLLRARVCKLSGGPRGLNLFMKPSCFLCGFDDLWHYRIPLPMQAVARGNHGVYPIYIM